MKAAVIAVLCFILAAAVVEGQVCHYDCYNVTSDGANAKSALLKQCGVVDYKVTSSGDLSGTFKKGAAPGCSTASCALYTNEAAIQTYRDTCEHPDPKYALLKGKGTSYNAPCATCQ